MDKHVYWRTKDKKYPIFLFDIAPETPTNVEAKFQAIESDFQPEEDSHDDKKKKSKIVRIMRDLQALREDNKLQSKVQEGFFYFFIKDNEIKNPIEEPTTFVNAWYHNDDAERKKWQDAISLEFNHMMKNEGII
jgi:hypothetical protein